MQLRSKKRHLAILSILAGLIYFLIILTDLASTFEAGKRGFSEGMNEAMNEAEVKNTGSETFTVFVKPNSYKNILPDSVINVKQGKIVSIGHQKFQVKYIYQKPIPANILILYIFTGITAIPLFVLLILIPVYFYKLIIAFYRDEIFTNKNVRKIRRLGIAFVTMYMLNLLFVLLEYFTVKKFFEFSNYQIAMPNMYHEWLLTGVVLFIAAIAMKRAIVLKEEQELTI